VTCLFCPDLLDGSDEHIILNAIGGRISSKRLICSKCNNTFGSTIDKTLLEAVDFMTLIIEPPTRRRSNGATMRVLDSKGVKYGMRAGGRLVVPTERIDDGRWVGDASNLDSLLEHVRRATDARSKRTGETVEIAVTKGTRQPGVLPFQISIDNDSAMRASLKGVIELLAFKCLESEEDRDLIPRLERNFVLNGKNPPLGGYLERSLVPYMFEGLEHYILLAQSPGGYIYWETSIYGGAIALAGRTEAFQPYFDPVIYRVDPVTGKQSIEEPALVAEVADAHCWWVAEYEADCLTRSTEAVQRMSSLMNRRHIMPDDAISAIIAECFSKCVPTEGIFTEAHSAALSRCIAEKYMALAQASGQFQPYDPTQNDAATS
jgi:hypothetical protein